MYAIRSYYERYANVDMKTDKLVFIIPLSLHVYDIIIGYALGISQAYIPSVLITVIHCLFFYLKKKSVQTDKLEQKQVSFN